MNRGKESRMCISGKYLNQSLAICLVTGCCSQAYGAGLAGNSYAECVASLPSMESYCADVHGTGTPSNSTNTMQPTAADTVQPTTTDTVQERFRQERAYLQARLTKRFVFSRLSDSQRSVRSSGASNNMVPSQKISLIKSEHPENGISAGDETNSGLTTWATGALTGTDISQDSVEGDINGGAIILGLDKLLMTDKMVLGLGVGSEKAKVEHDSNLFEDEGSGVSITPYVAYQFSPQLMVQAVFSVAASEYENDQKKVEYYDGTRLMGDISGQYSWFFDAFTVNGILGLMAMKEDYNNEYNDVGVTELYGGLEGYYDFSSGMSLYGGANYYQELSSESDVNFAEYSVDLTGGFSYHAGNYGIITELFTDFNNDRTTWGGSVLFRYSF